MNRILKDELWQMWNVCTACEPAEGERKVTADGTEFVCPKYTLKETFEDRGGGVLARKSTVTNTSGADLTFTTLRSRFVFDGGEYEVYTQYNGWQNESQGEWMPLVTEITARSESVRLACGAVPFIALWNHQTVRGMAFHLLADSSWSISAKRFFVPGQNSYVGVELGLDAPNVKLTVKAGEVLELPEILYYEFRNKLDMDCYKLHRYCCDHLPKYRLPVVFNTWMYKFARVDFESTMKQIPAASEIGAEYFVIDAGWFGREAGWVANIGDWVENQNSGFKGRMQEIADAVRNYGMKFGLWFEIERALEGTMAAAEHPEYYIHYGNNYFVNFADPEAVSYIFDILCGIIDRYGVEFIKFDFNADLCFDPSAAAFTEYYQGYRRFIRDIRAKYPELYMSNCASGGMRMVLSNCGYFESFWLSDNQSPYHGMRIFKDSLLRIPPQVIEKWTVITSNNDTIPSYDTDTSEHIFATGDAVWERVSDVSESWLKGFLSCSPLGFSCDLESLSESVKAFLKEHIRQFKEERTFWQEAECHILADTPSVLVLQYNDRAVQKCVIHIFTNKIKQSGISVYPVLDDQKQYVLSDGSRYCGARLMNEGIYHKTEGNFRMMEVKIEEA